MMPEPAARHDSSTSTRPTHTHGLSQITCRLNVFRRLARRSSPHSHPDANVFSARTALDPHKCECGEVHTWGVAHTHEQ
jgi:hypothetical protein